MSKKISNPPPPKGLIKPPPPPCPPRPPSHETLIPSMALRFVEREQQGEYIVGLFSGFYEMKTVRILQQRFTTPGGQERWYDVPVYRESSDP